jgi:predicted nuclease of predicted toxin-antitoxin system
MSLLFDQNISFSIVKRIEDIFPGSISVRDLGYENPHDFDIWKFAKSNNLCIVTFDSDFIDLSNLRGFPPKIIWLRLGNTSTKNIADRIRVEGINIIEFLNSSEIAFLEIN